MVRVKTPSGWKTVPSGTDVSGYSRGTRGTKGTGRQATYQFDTITPDIISYVGGKKTVILKGITIRGSRSSSRAKALASLRQAEARQKAQEQSARAAAQKLAQQKAQEVAAAKLAGIKATQELNRITAIQQRILRDRGRVTEKKSRDVRTGNILNITTYVKNGDKVVRVFDTKTGEIRFNAYGVPRGGGSVRRVAGVVLGGREKQREEEIEIDLDNLSPSQAIALVNAGFTRKDVENWGEKLRGIEGLYAGTKGLTKRLIGKLERGEKLSGKDRLTLLILQFGIPAQQLIMGLKQLPAFTRSIKDDPKLLLAVPGQLWDGLKETGAEILALGKVSPALAIVRIGGELILMIGIGSGFKVLGKVTINVAKKISPLLKPIRGGSVILKTATRKGLGKIRVVSKKTGAVITKKYKIVRSIKKVRIISKTAKEVEISKFKSAIQYSNELKIARSSRRLARKKGRTINIGDGDFIEAVAFIEDVADKLSRSRAKQFLKKFKDKGGKLGLGQEEEFIKAVQRYINKTLNDFPAFKQLKNHAKLTEPFQIKLLRTGKIISAKKLFNKLRLKIQKLSLVKKMNSIIKSISKKVKKIRKGIKKGKIRKEAEIRKFKSAVEWRDTLKQARRIRKIARKKGRTINIGNDDYIKAVVYIEEFANNLAKFKARNLIKKFKQRGVKLGLGQEQQIINTIQRYVNKTLKNLSEFKKLKNTAKLNKPFQIKLLRTGKINTAKKMFNNLKIRIQKLPIAKQISLIVKRIGRKIRKIKRKFSPRRMKRVARLKKMRKAKIREFRKTIRYRMEKARKIRKVTFEQLNRASSINQARKFIDRFFNEIGRRQKIDIGSLKFRQLKNIIKKRISKAIRRGDKVEIAKFRNSIKQMINEMNKPSKAPVVRIVKKGTRSYRTIKEFKPETPKGQYVEIKSGNQVLLQEVRQIQKVRRVQKTIQIQKLAPPKQIFVIQSVTKQSINFKPLVRYAIFSLSAQAFKNMQKTKQVFAITPTTAQLSKVLQDSAQDFRTLQIIGQSSALRLNVAQAVAQDVRSRQRFGPKQRTKQILKKKKVLKVKFIKKKNIRILPKKVMTYAFVIKKFGKNVRLKIPPLTLRDAWDVGSYRLDHDLQRTGTLIAIGMTKKVAVISKNIKGYYGKHKFKFRRFRVKKGKKFTLQRTIIERKRYIGDTRSELAALKRARKEAKRTRRRKPKKNVNQRVRPSKNRVRRQPKKIKPVRRRVIGRKPVKRKKIRRIKKRKGN